LANFFWNDKDETRIYEGAASEAEGLGGRGEGVRGVSDVFGDMFVGV